jgi:hypothetical protein
MDNAIETAATIARTLTPGTNVTIKVVSFNDYRGIKAGTRLVFSIETNIHQNSKAALAILKTFRSNFISALSDTAKAGLRTHGRHTFNRAGFWNMGQFDTTAWNTTIKTANEG